jgi:hypothetical protein
MLSIVRHNRLGAAPELVMVKLGGNALGLQRCYGLRWPMNKILVDQQMIEVVSLGKHGFQLAKLAIERAALVAVRFVLE